MSFPSKKELDEYLLMLEEAKKRDHRKLGKELGIYTMDDDVGQGLILWMPNGTIIIEELEKLAKETEQAGRISNGWLPPILPRKACISPAGICLIMRTVCIRPWNWTGEILSEINELPASS